MQGTIRVFEKGCATLALLCRMMQMKEKETKRETKIKGWED